jgi:hypothetical protein
MPVNYNNLPPLIDSQSQNKFIKAVDAYSETPIELDSATFDAITGFFTNKNFNKIAAQSIAVIIISQCKRDNLNPMKVLDTMQGIETADLSLVLTEILNFNRYNSSFIGYSSAAPVQSQEVFRNIIENTALMSIYTVLSQNNVIYEGDRAVFFINIKDVLTGTILYWDLNGSDTQSTDFINGQVLNGQIQVINDGITSVRSYPVTISTKFNSNFKDFNKKLNLNIKLNSPTNQYVAQGQITILPRDPEVRIIILRNEEVLAPSELLNLGPQQKDPHLVYETTSDQIKLLRYAYV